MIIGFSIISHKTYMRKLSVIDMQEALTDKKTALPIQRYLVNGDMRFLFHDKRITDLDHRVLDCGFPIPFF